MRFLGTLINVAAVIAGSLIGLFFHARLPKRFTTVAFQGIGLFTLFIGFTMAAKTKSLLVLVFSIVLGAISGELLDIDRMLNRFGEMQQMMKKFGKFQRMLGRMGGGAGRMMR